jgi:hypothetical protein
MFCLNSGNNWAMVFQNVASNRTGVDVMITIFAIFANFPAKKWRFSKKPML